MADLSRVQKWVTAMERLGQMDSPFVFGGVKLTPRQLLQHATANDSIWKQVQNYLP